MKQLIYRFRLADDSFYEHKVSVAPDTTESSEDTTPPEWARLTFHQCSNCTLKSEDYPYCPVARRLPPLIEMANQLSSYDRIVVEVEHRARLVSQVTSAQRALSSLLGLVMATSECPHTAYLRPMARFHLPLATEEETAYRAASMYLLAQYFLHREGQPVDFNLDGLARIYNQLQQVNIAMVKRIRDASSQDTASNAIVLLDILAKGVPYSIEDSMSEYRDLFSAYLKGSTSKDDAIS